MKDPAEGDTQGVIQLQGDQRENVKKFLIDSGLAKKENVNVHGF